MARPKLLLINPYDRWCHYINWRTPAQPLALAYLAALTPPGWDIDLIDECFEPWERACARHRPDLVGITVMTPNAHRAYGIAAYYRKQGIPVVGGGIHIKFDQEPALQYFRAIVIGEAENAWQDVLRDSLQGRLRQRYAGEPADLEKLCLPERGIFQRYRYTRATIQTRRGCGVNCHFCAVPAFSGLRQRSRPPEGIVEEMRRIPQKILYFVDDNFTGTSAGSIERTKQLLEAVIRQRVKKRWVAQATLHCAEDEELLKMMRKSGCLFVYIGIEGIDARTLDELGKNMNEAALGDRYRSITEKFHKHGIGVIGNLMLGAGHLDTQYYAKIRKFLWSSRFDRFYCNVLAPFPGTVSFERLKNQDRLYFTSFPHDWRYYNIQTITVKNPGLGLADEYNLIYGILKEHTKLRYLAWSFLRSLWSGVNLPATLSIAYWNLYCKLTQKRWFGRIQREFKALLHP